MKEKGGKRSYILDATKKAKNVYIPECKRKDFSSFVDLATISTILRDLRESRLIKSGDKELAEEDKRSLENMRIKGEKVDPLDVPQKARWEKWAFGWASEEWSHQEIYAMNPQDPEWVDLVLSAYQTLLDQPQHDGVFVDMVMNVSWCPDAITNEEWSSATREILKEIKKMAEARKKVVFLNAGFEMG